MTDVADVEQLLAGPIGMQDVSDVALIGRGAWSTAYGFVQEGRALVIRVGRHVSDFRRDEAMAQLATDTLPIPTVIEIGNAPSAASSGLHYCISTRAFGEPLESVPAREWPDLAERVADVLEAMRASPAPCAAARDEGASVAPWREQLLNIGRDDLDPRGARWQAKLATSDRGSAAFDAGFARLDALRFDAVPLTLVHGDLINRNVHVDRGSITGVFDWGCQRWGDHLFDLCWFDFWAPWHPNLDPGSLRAALERRWEASGYEPEQREERRLACLVYIGLEHLIYNATIERWDDLDAVVDRMTALDLI